MPFELNLQNFFWIQGVILLLGIGFLLWRPRSEGSFTLRMGKPSSTATPPLKRDAPVPQNSAGAVDISGAPKGPRQLQVFFNYNGHSFEAFEVLGLPAGSNVSKMEDAIRVQIQSAEPQSRPFLEAAFQALKASRN